MGVDYDDTLPGQRRVYLHWRAGGGPATAQLYAGEQVMAQGEVVAPPRTGVAPPRTDHVSGAWRGAGYVTTALDVPQGTGELRLALRGRDQTLPARGAWGFSRTRPVRLPRAGAGPVHYLPFGGKPALVGMRVKGTWAAGRQERVALRFLGLRPMVRDYVVSLGLEGSVVSDAPSDWVPALGAMPTFKWIRGSRVNDVHLVNLVEGRGEAELTLGIYDAFTMLALPPLDERFARQGRAAVSLRPITIE